MGYFSNGSEGDGYYAQYCERCIHNDLDKGCAVWGLHLVHNYEECNKDDSFLHSLIPRADCNNERCRMFWPRGGVMMELIDAVRDLSKRVKNLEKDLNE